MTADATITASLWPRGSEWRKWDLHVHSLPPENSRATGTGSSSSWATPTAMSSASTTISPSRATRKSCAGLPTRRDTEGNKAYREALEKLRRKTLLPVVECRMTNVVIGQEGRRASASTST